MTRYSKEKEFFPNLLENYKFPSVEQTTYDRAECIARNQIYPTIGERLVGDVTASDVRNLLNECMNKGLAYSTVKKVYVLLNEYFRTIYLEEEYYFREDAPLICDEHGDYTKPVNFRKRYYRILKNAGIELKGIHSLRHTFATRLVNGIKQPNGSIKALSPKQVADLLGHSTSQITEMYYVKKDTSRLNGITDGFDM